MTHPDIAIDLELLRQWRDRSERHATTLAPEPAMALAAMLDHAQAPPMGAPLPPLWQWLYFWSPGRQSELGPDGHPQLGGFLPPVPLPRRMWAGGRLRFEHSAPALTLGAPASKLSRIASVDVKQGKSGTLAFVSVLHAYRARADASALAAIHEEQDLVYRAMPQPGASTAAPVMAPPEATADWRRQVDPDPVLLMRYSALTLNGHRIHYDRDYATGVEGYPGLVVHGPLIATLLADLLVQHLPGARLVEFNFRAVASLFDTEPFTLCGQVQPDTQGKRVLLWACNRRGELAMQAQALLA